MSRALTRILFAYLLGLCQFTGVAQDPLDTRTTSADVRDSLRKDIASALSAYETTLSQIEAEKLALVRQINAVENEIIDARNQRRNWRSLNAEREASIREATDTLQELEAQSSYIDGVLKEFSSGFLSTISQPEQQFYIETARIAGEANRDEKSGFDQRIEANLVLVEETLARLESAIGGYTRTGKAIASDGSIREGDLLLIGPAAFFVSPSDNRAGILRKNPGTVEPAIHTVASGLSLPSDRAQSNAVLLLDPTFKAFELREAKGSLADHLKKGGWVGYVILGLGGLAVLVALFKAIDIKRLAPRDEPRIRDFRPSGDPSLTPTLPDGRRNDFVTRLIRTWRENSGQGIELLEEMLLADVLEYRLRLERSLPILALTASTAPLLGLLGTVVGMIKTFTLITIFGTGDAKALSSGISEALVTTELGLIIAVPALVLHGALNRAIKARIGKLENLAFEIIKVEGESRK